MYKIQGGDKKKTFYIDSRIPGIGEKPRTVIVDDNGNIINRNPTADELKGLNRFPKENYKRPFKGRSKKYTDEELDYHLIRFFVENGSPSTMEDFTNNPEYPSYSTYVMRFGSWANALKRVGLDVESMVKRGILVTCQQKGRFAEIIVRDHFEKHSVDLAGENKSSPCDGICPNGKTYDVKSSKLLEHNDWLYYLFRTNNKYKDKIEIYYFLAFNEDWTKVEYGWRIPGEIAEKDNFYVGMYGGEFNIENMKEYDITDNIRDILRKYGFFNKVKNDTKS